VKEPSALVLSRASSGPDRGAREAWNGRRAAVARIAGCSCFASKAGLDVRCAGVAWVADRFDEFGCATWHAPLTLGGRCGQGLG
jgi:hypothetical protein